MASHAHLSIGSSQHNQLIEKIQEINKSHDIKRSHDKMPSTPPTPQIVTKSNEPFTPHVTDQSNEILNKRIKHEKEEQPLRYPSASKKLFRYLLVCTPRRSIEPQKQQKG